MTESLLNRFLTYVGYPTTSDEKSHTVPSTEGQLVLAKKLYEDCIAIGLSDVSLDTNGYVMATLPSNQDKSLPTIGFIAHMDTASDCSGENIKPSILLYQGGTITLHKEKGITLSTKQYKDLEDLKGETLITTNGTTLLGADDKCGIAEILTAFEYLMNHPEIPHGTLKLCFTPDEETGNGCDYFNVEAFNADFAYTVDGGKLGELEAENFHAASAIITINGSPMHPGYAKDKMLNSMTVANSFQQALPSLEVPECTEKREGFFHLCEMKGDVAKTTLHYIIRDFDRISFENRKKLLLSIQESFNHHYGKNTIEIEITDTYANMKEILDQFPHIIELAKEAFQSVGIIPSLVPIRGGTDGARLSFMGLPCPNLFTGGYLFHSPYEFAVLSHMEAATKVIIEIARMNAL